LVKSEEQVQKEVELFWDAKPCDSDTSAESLYSVDFYKDIEDTRYDLQSHIMDLLPSLGLESLRVLEIGTGVGTDARSIVRLGGDYTGINVDAGSCEATRRALELFHLPGKVHQASAVDMPFPDNSFDLVYSFGVLMCIPEVDRAVNEIYRVLKPGGRLVIMLYNRTSINYQIEIRYLRKWGLALLGLPGMVSLLGFIGLPKEKLERHLELRQKMGKMSDEEWLSRNTDGPDNPYATVYDADETRALLRRFESIDQELRFFDYRHWGLLGRLIPNRMRRALGERWGWHRMVTARRPLS
jgi:ubiquinone/menaquinone biosynthesis C-methylase UbiE